MIKWFVYIVLLLILMPFLLSAKISVNHRLYAVPETNLSLSTSKTFLKDTTKTPKQLKQQQDADDKKKVKELTNAKHLPKPEKLDQAGSPPSNPPQKTKPKRQRRPPGLERPPELPRRYGN